MTINAIAPVGAPQANTQSPVRDLPFASGVVGARLTAPDPVGNDPGAT